MTPEGDWLVPGRAKAGDTCPGCGLVFTGGEPFCGRLCGAVDPAVRWEVVVLMQDISYTDSETLGYRVHTDLRPFADAENQLADSETRSERAVVFALDHARGTAAFYEAAAQQDDDET